MHNFSNAHISDDIRLHADAGPEISKNHREKLNEVISASIINMWNNELEQRMKRFKLKCCMLLSLINRYDYIKNYVTFTVCKHGMQNCKLKLCRYQNFIHTKLYITIRLLLIYMKNTILILKHCNEKCIKSIHN